MRKNSVSFSLAHQAQRVSGIDFAGAEDTRTYQQFYPYCVDTPDGNVQGCSNEFAAFEFSHLGIGGIRSESLTEPASLSEYLTKIIDQSSKGFIFEQDLDGRTLAGRVENPENGTSSFLRRLDPLTWELVKQPHQQNEPSLGVLKLIENHVCIFQTYP
jgi:hypothetical protein